jgi:hypothetical protein
MLSLRERIEKRKEKYILEDENQTTLQCYNNYKSSWYNYKQRLYDRIYKMLEDEAYFTTLTYANVVGEYTARKDMEQWSRTNCDMFISNIDYGDDNNRIHIHSVCTPKKDIKLVESWKYGLINIKKVKNTKIDGRKVVMYVSKMVNHAIKESAGKVIRSKKTERREIQ